jgi:competence protein ComEC
MTVFELELHGLAVALETPSGAVYLVDTGRKNHGADVGKDTLSPFLKKLGVSEIAGVLISHPHHDHFEGAAYLLKHFTVKTLIDAGPEGPLVPDEYAKFKASAAERGVPYRSVRAGDVLRWDDALDVEVLAPPRKGVPSTDDEALNDNSIVLRIRHGENVFLLPGDIVKAGREALLASVPAERLRSTVLIAPHHGFMDGHSFIKAIHPRFVVVSCLADYPDKKIRSPGQHVTELFRAMDTAVYVTAWDGNVEFESDGTVCTVRSARPRK